MQTLNLNIHSRETGKKATKAVRNAGLVPCVLYGQHTDPVHFAVESLDVRPLIHTTETYRIAVTVDGEEYEAILKSVDFHPVTDAPIHMDFQALTAGEALTMTVPVSLEGTAPGIKEGGILSQPLSELEIRALPKDIPGHISINVSNLSVGDSLHVSDLQLGEDIEVLTDEARTIVTITAPRLEVEEEPTDDLLGLDGDLGAEDGDASGEDGDDAEG